MSKKKSSLEKAFIFLISVSFLLCVWNLAALVVDSPLILPSPDLVVRSIMSLVGSLLFWKSALSTFCRVLIAFVISGAAGVAIGALCARYEKFRLFMEVPLAVIGATPVVSIILLSIFWLGSGNVPVLCGVLMAFPVMVHASCKGFSACDRRDFSFARCFCLSPRQVFVFIKLPKAMPYIESGIKTSSSMVWKVCAAAEVLAVPRNALGAMMQRSQVTLETQELLALTVLIVLFSCIWNWGLRGIFCAFRTAGKKMCDRWFSRGASYSSRIDAGNDFSGVHVRNFTSSRPLCYRNFSFSFLPSNPVAVTGESGCGKTTLLDFMAGLLESEDLVEGTVDGSTQAVSYSFQDPYVLERLTVRQNLLLPLTNAMSMEQAERRVSQLISVFELEEKADELCSKISGGQKERVSIARTLAFPSKVLLLDEPFTSQDRERFRRLEKVLADEISAGERTVVMVTHNIKFAQEMGFSLVELENSAGS